MKRDSVNEERFEQLCALAAIGEVSAAEFAELNEHLATCSNCQELYADFRRIASNELGAVATGRWSAGDSSADLDEQVLLGRVLERAQAETRVSAPPESRPLHAPRRRLALFGVWRLLRSPILATPALIVVMSSAVGVAAYRYRDQQLAPTVAQLNSEWSRRDSEVERVGAQVDSTSTLLQRDQSEREALQHALAEARKSYAESMNRDKVLETDLA